MRPNPNLYPPGGYRFRDPASDRVFTGSSWVEVTDKLIAFRKGQQVPLGKPLAEVYEQFCERHPNYCTETRRSVVVNQVSAVTLFYNGVVAWLARMAGYAAPRRTVSREEAARRREICANCRAQEAPNAGCGGCAANFQKLRTAVFRQLGGSGRWRLSERLRSCAVLHEDTSISVWLVQPPRGDCPAHCWRRHDG